MKIKTERQENCKVGFLRRTIGFLGLKIEVFSVLLQSFEFCKLCQENQKTSYFSTCSSPERNTSFHLSEMDFILPNFDL